MQGATEPDVREPQALELPIDDARSDSFTPRFPVRLDELDVGSGFLTDLALKAVSLDPDATTGSIGDKLHLGMVVTDTLLNRLVHEQFLEKKGAIGLHHHRYGMTERGWNRVAQLMGANSYVGPAPVSLELYTEMIVNQVRSRPPVSRETLDHAIQGLVLSDPVKRRLGLVASSGRSLFLSGPPGNGKTAMARALVNAISGAVWIPYAIEVDSQVIRVFDKHDHHPVKQPAVDYDRRWVRIRPPLVTVGGELTIQSLDLTYAESPRYYEAPFQLKANGGVLVVDDLGRQRVSATELLNRWIVPLEYRSDYLTLSTGKKIQVPFEQIVIFATNLSHADLVDAAFMRRMGYRLYVQAPTPETYRQIFREYVQSCGLPADERLIDQMLERYQREKRLASACEPRDLIARAIELCRFDGKEFQLTADNLNEAWDSYFGGPDFTRKHLETGIK